MEYIVIGIYVAIMLFSFAGSWFFSFASDETKKKIRSEMMEYNFKSTEDALKMGRLIRSMGKIDIIDHVAQLEALRADELTMYYDHRNAGDYDQACIHATNRQLYRECLEVII